MKTIALRPAGAARNHSSAPSHTNSDHSARHFLIVAALIAILSFAGLIAPAAVFASNTIWSSSAVPATASYPDARSVELGVKFRSDLNGYITGLRFYKGSANTGTHVGHLWTSTGTLLASATFTNETASGWQQVNLATPIAITANTVYVASYYAPNGGYSVNRPYFAASYDNPPLHALADGTSGANGVHYYPGNAFPTVGYDQSNYWVDVVFATTVTPASNTIWSSSAVPATASYPDTRSVELGVKFRSDVNGHITGLRFYKGSANTGTHVGHLWTSTGTLLASATFSNETTSGWQQVNLATPVAITANTVYVASYYAPNGGYSVNRPYFTSSYDNPPLHALADGTSGANGVHYYPGNAFPTVGYDQSNYWVDVVFSSSSSSSNSTLTVTNVSPASGPAAGGSVVTITGTNFQSGATVSFGGTNSTAVTVISSSQINAMAPAHSAGAVSITVSSGGSSATWAGTFTYTSAPIVNSVSPNSGPVAGGTTVTILGSGFESGAIVKFGAILAASATFISPTQIQAVTPAETASTVSVSVQNPDPASGTLNSAFTFLSSASAPTIAGISPNSNVATGGATVTITGSNFQSGATVRFGNNASNYVSLVSSTQIQAIVPAGTAETTVSVTVTNTNGQSVTLPNAFFYGKTLFSDGFESGSFSAWDNVWTTTDDVITSSVVHSGTHAAQVHYYLAPSSTGASRDSNRFFAKYFNSNNGYPSGLSHYFVRGYVQFATPIQGNGSGAQRKLFYLMANPNNTGWSMILNTYADAGQTPQLALAPFPTGQNGESACLQSSDLQNSWGLYNFSFNTWYEVEMEVQANTPGSCARDGYVNVWVNGTQVLHRTGMNVRGNDTSGSQNFQIGDQLDSGVTNAIEEYRYWDDIAIGDAYVP